MPEKDSLSLPTIDFSYFGKYNAEGAECVPTLREGALVFDIGQWIEDQYLVLERHRGRRWTVYVVQDRISENVFVIKRPSEVLLPDPLAADHFVNEARIWINIGECDEVVNAYLIKEFEGIPHLFLEYTDGPSLEDILSSRPGKPLPTDQAVALMRQLINGMKFLHSASLTPGNRGVVHGSLTPHAILTKSGNIKITDVGLAHALRQSSRMLNAGHFLWDISYMAPEQLQDLREADKLTDIYSFGAIMYEVATGTSPMMGKKPEDPLSDIVRFEPAHPRTRNRSCPRWLEETILKCMARERANRFQSFELIDAFVSEVLRGEEEASPARDAKEETDSAHTSRVARVRGVAKKESRRLDHYYVGVEHLMLGLIAEEESVVVSCFGDAVDAERLRSEILSHLPKGEGPWYWDDIRKTPRYKRVMKLARKIKREHSDDRMLPQHILLAILKEGRNVPVRVLKGLNVDVKAAARNLRREMKRRRPAIFVADSEPGAISFTIKVACTTDIPCSIPFVGRRSELERARGLLLDDRRSVMIVGEPGVGKTAFVHELECLVSEASGDAGRESGGLVKLHVASLIASTEGGEQIISNLTDAINSVVGSKSILVIEDLPVVVGLGGKLPPGAVGRMLEEYIVSKGLVVVATTTRAGYVSCEAEHENLVPFLEVINLREPSSEETFEMLVAAKETLENEHSVRIVDEALTASVDLSREIQGRALPARAFELLDRACVGARLSASTPEQAREQIVIDAERVEYALAEARQLERARSDQERGVV